MIRVKFYNLLAERSLSGRDEYDVPFADGLQPLDLIHREGFHGEEAEAIVVLVNEEQATRETPLSDGDRVEFLINMVGGAGERPCGFTCCRWYRAVESNQSDRQSVRRYRENRLRTRQIPY